MVFQLLDKLANFTILRVNRLNQPTQGHGIRKNRECFSFMIKTEGKSIFKENNKEYIVDNSNILFIPKGATYKWECVVKGEMLMIDFDAQTNGENFSFGLFKVKNQMEYIKLFNRMEINWTFKKEMYNLKCLISLYEFIVKLSKIYNDSYIPSKKTKIIEPSIKYLESNYHNPELSNESLAVISNISVVYFRKLFTEIFGVSPMKYVQNIRISKAKDLLRGEFVSISEIAQVVGFSSIYRFSKVFKQETGYSPTEFSKLKYDIHYELHKGDK